MRKPIILRQGLLQGAEEKVRISQLNLGLRKIILVTGQEITIFSNLHHLQANTNQNVRTILGGEEGDFLLLTGQNVRLRSGGNIAVNNIKLESNKFFLLLNIGSVWIPSL